MPHASYTGVTCRCPAVLSPDCHARSQIPPKTCERHKHGTLAASCCMIYSPVLTGGEKIIFAQQNLFVIDSETKCALSFMHIDALLGEKVSRMGRKLLLILPKRYYTIRKWERGPSTHRTYQQPAGHNLASKLSAGQPCGLIGGGP